MVGEHNINNEAATADRKAQNDHHGIFAFLEYAKAFQMLLGHEKLRPES